MSNKNNNKPPSDNAANDAEKESLPLKCNKECAKTESGNNVGTPSSGAQIGTVSASTDTVDKHEALTFDRKRRHSASSSEQCSSSSLLALITAKGKLREKWLTEMEEKYSRMEQELGVDDDASDVVDFGEDSMDEIMEKIERSEQKLRTWEQKAGCSSAYDVATEAEEAEEEVGDEEAEEAEDYLGDDETEESEEGEGEMEAEEGSGKGQ